MIAKTVQAWRKQLLPDHLMTTLRDRYAQSILDDWNRDLPADLHIHMSSEEKQEFFRSIMEHEKKVAV